MPNTNTNSPRRRINVDLPIVSPDRTSSSSSVSNHSYSLDNDNPSTETNTSINDEYPVYDTTDKDTNNYLNGKSSSSTRLSRMLFGKVIVWSIFIFATVSVLPTVILPTAMCTSDPTIYDISKTAEDTTGSSSSTAVSIYTGNAHRRMLLLNSKSGIPHLEAPEDFVCPQIIPASKRSKEKENDNKSILYMMSLDLPVEFMGMIEIECYPLWYNLKLTKIGQSESWPAFLQKMRKLQMYNPFSRLKYIAIEHDHPPEVAEKAMHYVFMAYHVKGEWYYMTTISKMYLISKFPGSNIYGGYTTRPGRGSVWHHEEGVGHVYLAKFDWNTQVLPNCLLGELETIRGILNNATEPAEHKDSAEDMLLTKTGSTIDIRARLSLYTYAQVFANMTYRAFPHRTIRQQELDIQNDWGPYWKVGEWYALDYPEHWDVIGNLTYPLPTNIQSIQFEHGVYRRMVEQSGIFRHDLVMWRHWFQHYESTS